ncbi:helix-turn-helix domain-containing protein [Runella limosa]|uniref:helix-turn-helix domain-containing protein n=1 Tax=Runella limosa TaxID=370978 RepID=UPI00041A5D7A|nr:AraC family transcriptional regulator [Runella limosa]
MRAITKDKKSAILREQFIPDHVFFYIQKGGIRFFDGDQNYTFREGQCGIALKNRLAKFSVLDSIDEFEPIIICFEEAFLKDFLRKYPRIIATSHAKNVFINLTPTALIAEFIRSLKPYYKDVMELDEAFEELKHEELLLILLRNQPEIAHVLFDFGIPEKINLEAFMNRNFTFNVSLQRFSYMTGRSLSAFKRDFKAIFNETPSRWLVQRRLEEAFFLLQKKNRKPSEIYLELGFETLAHFSTTFKKRFGLNPTALIEKNT